MEKSVWGILKESNCGFAITAHVYYEFGNIVVHIQYFKIHKSFPYDTPNNYGMTLQIMSLYFLRDLTVTMKHAGSESTATMFSIKKLVMIWCCGLKKKHGYIQLASVQKTLLSYCCIVLQTCFMM